MSFFMSIWSEYNLIRILCRRWYMEMSVTHPDRRHLTDDWDIIENHFYNFLFFPSSTLPLQPFGPESEHQPRPANTHISHIKCLEIQKGLLASCSTLCNVQTPNYFSVVATFLLWWYARWSRNRVGEHVWWFLQTMIEALLGHNDSRRYGYIYILTIMKR
jgi:hypothetical protein